MFDYRECPKCGEPAKRNHDKGSTGGNWSIDTATGAATGGASTDRHYECKCGNKFVVWVTDWADGRHKEEIVNEK